MNVSGLPYCEGYCGRARLAMVNSGKGTWHQRGDGYVPSAGDLIYYGNLIRILLDMSALSLLVETISKL